MVGHKSVRGRKLKGGSFGISPGVGKRRRYASREGRGRAKRLPLLGQTGGRKG